jgi:uncharacterized membrane protein YqjE
MTPNAAPERADPGTSPGDLLSSMVRTRLELAALDIEAHVSATLQAIASGIVALVLALVAFGFVGVAIIALFWDTHRIIATVATALGYFVFAFSVAVHARNRWRSRPPALEGTLRELALDREALRSLS